MYALDWKKRKAKLNSSKYQYVSVLVLEDVQPKTDFDFKAYGATSTEFYIEWDKPWAL